MLGSLDNTVGEKEMMTSIMQVFLFMIRTLNINRKILFELKTRTSIEEQKVPSPYRYSFSLLVLEIDYRKTKATLQAK